VPPCRKAIAAWPDSPALHHQLGVALESAGRLPAAIAEYQTALRFAPGNPTTSEALARALEKRARRQAQQPEADRR
jgi:Flp pilus assembly protein TadD